MSFFRPPSSFWLRLLAAFLAAAFLGAQTAPIATVQGAGTPVLSTAAAAQGPIVDGVALETTTVGGRPLHYDRDVPREAVEQVGAALEASLVDVPRLASLPPVATPLVLHVLADQQRFRAALAELAGVRIELVGEQIGAYAIERGGTMLLFFQRSEVSNAADARLSVSHELAHLAVREASAWQAIPQWLNEGYAEGVAQLALGERYPHEAAALWAADRAAVASALHTRGGLLPWSELVSRTRFSRAGTEGLTFLAYGQSKLFVDWLAQRHATSALAAFLFAIGGGASATEAFQATLGPFGPQAAAFEASVTDLLVEFRPGLHRLSPDAQPGQAVAFAVVGGTPGEQAATELQIEGVAPLRRERSLDATGFLLIGLDPALTARPGLHLLRVTSPSLGTLELPIFGGPASVEWPAQAPLPAPVQLPRPAIRTSSEPIGRIRLAA